MAGLAEKQGRPPGQWGDTADFWRDVNPSSVRRSPGGEGSVRKHRPLPGQDSEGWTGGAGDDPEQRHCACPPRPPGGQEPCQVFTRILSFVPL